MFVKQQIALSALRQGKSNDREQFSVSFRVREELKALGELSSQRISVQPSIVADNSVAIAIFIQLNCNPLKPQRSLEENIQRRVTTFATATQEDCQVLHFQLLLHPKYPLSPPLLFCHSRMMFPRLDDYRDYLEDVLGGEWWPSITVKDIIEKLYEFAVEAGKISPSCSLSSLSMGTVRLLPIIYETKTLRESFPGLQLKQAQIYTTSRRLFGHYEPILLGVSWNHLIIFEKLVGERCVICESWPLHRIKKIGLKRRKNNWSRSKINNMEALLMYEAEVTFIEKFGEPQFIRFEQAAQVPPMSKENIQKNDSFSQLDGKEVNPCEANKIVQLLRSMGQYIQLRSYIKDKAFDNESKIRLLSSVMEQLEQSELEVMVYYNRKLKELISMQYGMIGDLAELDFGQ